MTSHPIATGALGAQGQRLRKGVHRVSAVLALFAACDIPNGDRDLEAGVGPVGDIRFLSDLPIVATEGGYGPLELDTSNGEESGGDGQLMRVGVHSFAKGLGTHAPSKVTVDVPSDCVAFGAQAGIDQEVGNQGSVSFQVFEDGALIWDTGRVDGSITPRGVFVAVTPGSRLELVVVDGGDGNAFDHADWADAHFVCPSPPREVIDHVNSAAVPDGVRGALTRSPDEARRAFADYLKGRPNPRYFPGFEGPSPAGGTPNTREADELLQNRFRSSFFGPAETLGDPLNFGDPDLVNHAFVHRNRFVRVLADAFGATGDRRYLDKCVELMRLWRSQVPTPAFADHRGAYNPFGGATRVREWIHAFYRMRASLASEDVLMIVDQIVVDASLLMSTRLIGNYSTEIASSLSIAGLVFPELHVAERWKAIGLADLERQAREDLLGDGLQFELSPGYHVNVLVRWSLVDRLYSLNGRSLGPVIEEALERGFEALVQLSKPDKTMPFLNDSATGNYHNPWLAYAALRFRRPDFKFISSQSLSFASSDLGTFTSSEEAAFAALSVSPPAKPSYGLADSGLYTLRGGWNPDDLYVLFDLGREGGPHTHQARMAVEISALRRSFLVDPGVGSYGHSSYESFKDPAEHNLITIDGQGPTSAVRNINFVTGAGADGLSGEVAIGTANWRRTILLTRPSHIVIVDEVTGPDLAGKRVEQNWHYVPGTIEIGTEHVNLLYPTGPRMLMFWEDGDGLTFEEHDGFLSRGVNGTAPVGPGDAAPARYVVAVKRPTATSVVFKTLIYPFKPQ